MKRIMFIAICILLGAMKMSAQSREITPEQLDFRNQIQQFLKEEGYVPSVDEEDNSLVWKKEGTAYWLYVEAGPDPFYIEIHKGGFDLEGDKKLFYESCNYANLNQRCSKASVGNSSIIFTSELWCSSIDHFRKVFNKYISCLDEIKGTTADYYNNNVSK